MNRTRLFAAVAHVERQASRNLERPQRPVSNRIGKQLIDVAAKEPPRTARAVAEALFAPKTRAPLAASPAMRQAAAKAGLATAAPALVKRAAPEAAAKPAKAEPAAAAPKPAKPPLSDQARAKIAFRAARNTEIAALLSEHFPLVFRKPPVPLAIGIDKKILDALGDQIDTYDLRCFLSWWCRQPGYLDGLVYSEARRDLHGTAAGFPTAEQQHRAAEQVYGARADEVLARIAARGAAAEQPG